MGRFVFLVNPVIKPSLGPGPKFAVRYKPLPRPTKNTPKIAIKYWEIRLLGEPIKWIVTSNIIAIMIMFIIVPKPGFCFKKNHSDKTATLMKNVVTPIERSVIIDAPSAKTVHGEFPVVETTNKASPKPNNIKPKHKYENVETLGLKLNVSFELQSTTGIFLIDKNIFAWYFKFFFN